MSSPSFAGLNPAYVLHSRPYSNTSLLVDFFTLQSGRITCVARGVKTKKSRLSAVLQPFIPLVVSFSGRGAVKSLRKCEAVERYQALQGERLYSAYYLNELILKALPVSESHENIFALYAGIISELGQNTEPTEILLRKFEMHLLSELGYGLQLDHDAGNGVAIQKDKHYRYEHGRGPVEITRLEDNHYPVPVVSGDCLLALKDFSLTGKQHLAETKILMRYLINCLLGGYHFKSRDFFTNRYQRQ